MVVHRGTSNLIALFDYSILSNTTDPRRCKNDDVIQWSLVTICSPPHYVSSSNQLCHHEVGQQFT